MFFKMSFQEMKARPVRTGLSLLSIVIGTFAVVSVSITSETIRQAQKAMFSALSGKTDLEISTAGGSGFDGSLLAEIEETPHVRCMAPSLLRSTVMAVGEKHIKTQVMGISPEIDSQIRENKMIEGRMIREGFELVLDERLARSLKIQVGDRVQLLAGASGWKDWEIVGLIRPQGSASLSQGGILFAPLESAQSRFRARSRIDKIEILLDSEQNLESVVKLIEAKLPDGLKIKRPMQDNQIANETMQATEQGLRLASAFTLLIAIFIIYNTFQLVVGERRRQLGILRAIGATRQQIATYIHGEALLLGLVGAILGSILGIFGAKFLTGATSQILQTDMPSPHIGWLPFVLAGVFGLGVAWLGAWIPARRAGRLPPSEAMRVIANSEVESSSWRWYVFGFSMVGVGIVTHLGCALGWFSERWSIVASITALVGAVLILPILLAPSFELTQRLVAPILGIEARLAQKQLLRHRGRTKLITSVLFIAISTAVGLACTIIDNIQNVETWCSRALVGDYFIRAAAPDLSTGRIADLPQDFSEQLKEIPGIAFFDRFASLCQRQIGRPESYRRHSGVSFLGTDLL